MAVNGDDGPGSEVLGKVTQLHELRRVLDETVFYPAHAPRRESAGYRKMRQHLIEELNRPCIACGVTNATLGDRGENRFGATGMETHHKTVEWSLMKAVSVEKFNARIVQRFRHYRFHDPIYNKDFTRKQMEDWIDHHEDNIWVLCDVHHRHKWLGIHSITGPIWGPQDLIREDFHYLGPLTG